MSTTRRRTLFPVALVVATLLAMGVVGQAAALSTSYPHTSLGNRGVNVKTVQHLLRQHGATLKVDGAFGAATREAVKAFQATAGLTVNGQVGTETWRALRPTLALGATGEAVNGLKRQLIEKRSADLELDGVYDEATANAVRAFQRHAGLSRTGATNDATWRMLLSHLELPVWGRTMCDYSVGNGAANWGTASAIGQLQAAAHVVVGKGVGRIALGDIGYQHGGDIAGHQTHEHGLDVDIRPMRRANDQCRWGVNWRWTTYDRAATRALIKAIRATAPGHVKLIYFNDPVLIREGLVRWYTGHEDHLHVRYCERVHPVKAYDC